MARHIWAFLEQSPISIFFGEKDCSVSLVKYAHNKHLHVLTALMLCYLVLFPTVRLVLQNS